MHQPIKNWQQELADGFRNIEQLYQYLAIPIDSSMPAYQFPLRVPRGFVDRMEKGNRHDPLLKQVLPVNEENLGLPGYSNDPVGDIHAMAVPGVIHKYHGRVLLITTGSCAINCRYCFRRNFPYTEQTLSSTKLDLALQYIKKHNDITEVILSGGDPLLLNDHKLFNLLHQLDQIKHVKRIRIHSRIPIVLPSRINTVFCEQLSTVKKPIIMVIHTNHQNELNSEVQIACHKMKQQGLTLLNQSVLLKDINDDVEQLCALSEKLFTWGVLPYYLHLLDRAHGTAHFEVEQDLAISLMQQVKKSLPGYLVPKLVRDLAGADNKILIA